jgi:hypothetical protein
MLPDRAVPILFALLGALAITAVTASIVILRRGKLYHRLKPESRPRRWVLISMLTLCGVFIIWFPVWMIQPHALVSRVLTGLFAITFVVIGMAYKWFRRLIDGYVERKGWRLR